MVDVFPKDAFTKSVEFPKTLLAVEYVIEKNENVMFFSKYETYASEETLIQEAINNSDFLTDNSKGLHATEVFIIPLILETTRTQQKSFWTTSDKSTIQEWLQYKQEMMLKMLTDFEHHQAIVTCNYFDEQTPQFSCAGYFIKGNPKLEKEVVVKTYCPADIKVTEYAVYEIVKPYRYRLDNQELKTLN